jgi:hypothetical protein
VLKKLLSRSSLALKRNSQVWPLLAHSVALFNDTGAYVIENVRHQLEENLKKSFTHLSQEINFSIQTCRPIDFVTFLFRHLKNSILLKHSEHLEKVATTAHQRM